MSKNDEEKVTEDIEVLKLVKLSSQKNIENIDKKNLMKEIGWILVITSTLMKEIR